VLFSVVYKHINGTGEITLYLAQTGLPEYVSNMYVHVCKKIIFPYIYIFKVGQYILYIFQS